MSPLTKLFVVLLVVVSMLQSAATIVFVQKLGPLQPALDKATTERDLANQRAAAASIAAQTADDKYQQELQNHSNDRKSDSQLEANLQDQLNTASNTIATLRSDDASTKSNQTSLASSVGLANTSIKNLQDQNNSLRSENETLVKRSEEDARHLAELTQLTETLQSRLNDNQEQLAIEKDNNQKLGGWIHLHGGDTGSIIESPTATVISPAINGTVKEKSLINGNTYVTVNVGTSDGVSKGTKFNVLDHDNGQWLGLINIDSVDSNSAIGLLEGPADKVALVHAGCDVKTQLEGH